jgi:hypothetical protein
MDAYEELNPYVLRRWLLQREPDQATGFARDPFGCPIATWLEDLGAEQPEITPDTISYVFEGVPHHIPTPPVLSHLILAIDANAQCGEWLLSASRVLELLDPIPQHRPA